MKSAAPSPIRPNALLILILCGLASVLGMIDRQAVAVLKATLMTRMGLGDVDYGLLVTCFLAGYAGGLHRQRLAR